MTLAPGGVINVEAGRTLTSTGTINNTAAINNTKSTQINVSGIYTLRTFAYCSYFNVNNGGTYNHNVAGTFQTELHQIGRELIRVLMELHPM